MIKPELLLNFFPNGDVTKRSTQDLTRYETFKIDLELLTPFLPQDTSPQTRLFYLKLDIKEPQICYNPNCNTLVLPDRNNQFKKYCSNLCQRNDTNNLIKSNNKKSLEAKIKKESNVCEICNKILIKDRLIKEHRCSNFACTLIEKYNLKNIDDIMLSYKNHILEIINLLKIDYSHINWTSNPYEIFYCLNNNILKNPKLKFVDNRIGYKNIKKYKFYTSKYDLVMELINTEKYNASRYKIVREYFGDNYSEEIYMIINNIKEYQICECGNKIKFKIFSNPYSSGCSIQCINRINAKNKSKIKYNNFKIKLDTLLLDRNITILDEYKGMKEYQRIKCLVCGDEYTGIISTSSSICRKCTPKISGFSNAEIEVKEFIESLGFITESRRFVGLNEVDIFIPELNIGFEYNGLYWHSESMGKDKNYHKNKQIIANELGITLYHIFEHHWVLKRNIVESIIKSKLHKLDRLCYARQVIIKEIDNSTKNSFLLDNHIQGKDTSSIRLGAYFNSTLVSVMTFSKSKYKKDEIELSRFCTLIDYNISGMFSKFLKFFKNNYVFNNLISYADTSRNQGNKVYDAYSYKSEETPPSYWYFNGLEVYHRSTFMKHKLKDKLEIFDDNLTEYQNMLNNGYSRYWDCGTIKYYL
jgi:hypothetical protein